METPEQHLQTRSVEVLKVCLSEGIRIRIHLDEALTEEMVNHYFLENHEVENLQVVKSVNNGFFRFQLGGIIQMSGVFNTKEVTAQFHYMNRQTSYALLNKYFLHSMYFLEKIQ